MVKHDSIYSNHCPYKHSFIDRTGQRIMYFSSYPLNYTKTPDVFKISEIIKCILAVIPYIIAAALFITITILLDWNGNDPTIFHKDRIIKMSLIAILLLSPVFTIHIAACIKAIKRYEDEFRYYENYGYPIQPDKIEAKCPACDAENPNRQEFCSYCGCNLIKY